MKARIHSKSGFSLAEIIIAMTISAFVLTTAYAAIISLAKGSESMINYSEMNNKTRLALEIFGRDARATSEVYEFSASKFTGKREMFNPDTKSYFNRFVTYIYNPNAGTFAREIWSVVNKNGQDVPWKRLNSEILLYDVDQMSLVYYRLVDLDIPDYTPIAKSVKEIKHVQIEAKIQRDVLRLENTNYIISARFMMRNKDVSE